MPCVLSELTSRVGGGGIETGVVVVRKVLSEHGDGVEARGAAVLEGHVCPAACRLRASTSGCEPPGLEVKDQGWGIRVQG